MNLKKSFLFLITLLICFSGCDKIERNSYYQARIPVLEKMATIRKQALTVVAPQPIAETGKIYIFKDYLFISEPGKGIHIYNNANPAKPVAISFLTIPGNVDMAVKDDVLYADSYVDLLTFDLSKPTQPTLINRVQDVYKHLYIYNSEMNALTDVAVKYLDTIINSKDSHKYNPYITDKFEQVNFDYSNGSSGSNGSYGQGGSMARFTLASEHLYTVDNSTLNLFDVSNKTNPVFKKAIPLGWGIETIFPYKNNIFIGSNTGMHIYNIDNPASPELQSVYSHIRACDPVVVNDDYAFVTLRTGAACAGVVNVLEVVDIKDLKNPKQIKSFQMQNPHGLGLAGDVLYVCEGKFGFKSFDATNVNKVGDLQIEHFAQLKSTDVIPGPKSLIVIGDDGVCQYDYTNKKKLKLLSCISFEHPN